MIGLESVIPLLQIAILHVSARSGMTDDSHSLLRTGMVEGCQLLSVGEMDACVSLMSIASLMFL